MSRICILLLCGHPWASSNTAQDDNNNKATATTANKTFIGTGRWWWWWWRDRRYSTKQRKGRSEVTDHGQVHGLRRGLKDANYRVTCSSITCAYSAVQCEQENFATGAKKEGKEGLKVRAAGTNGTNHLALKLFHPFDVSGGGSCTSSSNNFKIGLLKQCIIASPF